MVKAEVFNDKEQLERDKLKKQIYKNIYKNIDEKIY